MQRRKVLIVDGYNVIRNNDRYRQLGDDFTGGEAWNKAREAVINDAALLAAGSYDRCTVVFDGTDNPASDGKPHRQAGIDVVFSPYGSSADTVIEKLAFDAREAGFEAVVVSSDFTIQSTVFGGGVTRMSSAGFASAGVELEEDWHATGAAVRKRKNTVSSRIDPEVAARLEAFVKGQGDL